VYKPLFTITPEINNRIAEIERIRAQVERTSILPEVEIHLRFRATVESVHSSTSIEGNPLNELQVQEVLSGKIVRAPDYAIVEVLNYKKALDWIGTQKSKTLTTKDILLVHQLLMENLLPNEKVGHFRPGLIYVVNAENKNESIEYIGPEANEVPRLIESLCKWLDLEQQKILHPILRAGLFHYLFVSVHPFSDGNGRMTRLLTQHLLQDWDYGFKETLSLDSYYVQHQLEYYKALSRSKTFDGRMIADITPFLDFFTKGFLESVQTLQQYVEMGKANTGKVPMRLNAEELSILDYAHQFGSVALADVINMLNIPRRTAQRRLQALVSKGIIEKFDQGPAVKYKIHAHSK